MTLHGRELWEINKKMNSNETGLQQLELLRAYDNSYLEIESESPWGTRTSAHSKAKFFIGPPPHLWNHNYKIIKIITCQRIFEKKSDRGTPIDRVRRTTKRRTIHVLSISFGICEGQSQTAALEEICYSMRIHMILKNINNSTILYKTKLPPNSVMLSVANH